MGKLIDHTGINGSLTFGLPGHLKVAEAAAPNGWKIRDRSRQFPGLMAKIRVSPLPNPDAGADRWKWRHKAEDYRAEFSASKTWEQLRPRHDEVVRSWLIWFSQGVPRFSFISWLAIRNRYNRG